MMAESSFVPILEIRDEFVTCEICLEYFNDGEKCPRILPCHHSFCCQCLISLWENSQQGVTCPNCRRMWPVQNSIEATFQQNKVLSNLVEYIALKNRRGEINCHDCPNESTATSRCIDCQEYMCNVCTSCHNKFTMSKHHKTVLITELVNMAQDEYFQQKEMCINHENSKLEIFCRACSTAVCPTCVLVAHRDHEICNLKDVYNEKKELIRTGLKDLQTSEENLRTYSERLTGDVQTLAATEQNLLSDIDESSNKIIAKVKEIATRLNEDVISKAAKQKDQRSEQIELIAQSESLKAEHILHCQQALQFARQVEFIEMCQVLEHETKNLVKTPELPGLEIEEIRANLRIFEQIDNLIEKPEIVCEQTTEDIKGPIVLCDTSQFRPCVQFSEAKTEHESNAITVTFFRKKNSYGDDKTKLPSSVEINQNIEGSLETAAAVGGSLEYKADTTGHHRTSISINGYHMFHDRFDFRITEQDEDLVRKILIGVDGRADEYREICLPNIEFNDWRRNRNDCEITSSGLLVNIYLHKPPFNPPDSLQIFRGVTDILPISGLGCWYWQTNVHCMVLEKAERRKVAAQVGVCVEGHCDDETQIANNRHAWCMKIDNELTEDETARNDDHHDVHSAAADQLCVVVMGGTCNQPWRKVLESDETAAPTFGNKSDLTERKQHGTSRDQLVCRHSPVDAGSCNRPRW
ncbi:E3 ubiquitin/ISG15 ligase TRIM25-like [Gigantopelta aegis]|uniref:E3 ubiquitin/ISG15 ligase TRIM25-like n=1 Tax=Gigantopelta aegis TaxID=1735272 RepID=UPI001B88D4FA|nr:E3 ubiquitin/ISG15 ligase TRIM25-like [Gigantopelta aegis]